MLTRTATPLIAVLLLVASCDLTTGEDAQKFSKRIISVNDSLLQYGRSWSSELQVATGDKDFSGLQPVREEMQDYLQRKVFDLKTMQDIGGSKELRQAQIDLLQFDQDSILPRFVIFESFNANTSDDQIMKTYSEMFSVLSREGMYLKKVHDLLDDYADANEFPKPIDKSVPAFHTASKPDTSGTGGKVDQPKP